MIRRTGIPGIGAIAMGMCALWMACGQPKALAAAPSDNSATAYIEGIEALEDADYGRAAQALTRAIEADGENESYRRARGVAYTLAESFPDAIADLKRAERLDANDTEARLWIAAAYRMSGDVATGASNFTMRDLPHDYANLVYNVMAMEYWQSLYQGSYYDPTTKQRVQASGPVKTLFPEAAKEYAQRHRASGPAAAAVITAQANDAIARGDWALALRDLVQLRADSPDDPTFCGCWAQALLGAGDAFQAREEFTRVLCVTPLWAEGYLGRAQAHLILGDGPRAEEDLKVAASLGAGRVEELRERLSKFVAPAAPADAVEQFEKAAAADAGFAQLVDEALAVHRLTNASRLRYDEAYQQRIRALSVAMRDDARNADYPEMLGRFLFDYYQAPVIWNGPRGDGQQLRPQSAVERNNEINRAIELCDDALKMDDRHANAMATKGWILYTIKAMGAEELADRGLSIDPDNVRLLDLKNRILGDRAGDLEAQASGLRGGHTDFRTENRPDGVYQVRTYYPPAAEQLAEAAQLDAQATQLRAQADQLQTHLKQVQGELIPALQKQGRDALDSADLARARRSFMEAYAHSPDSQEILAQLADVCNRQGDATQGEIYSLLAQPPQETTAAAELKTTWDACMHTMWKTAKDAADRAAAVDPADARVDAYRSVIAANRDDPGPLAARRWRFAALALEEARARLSGTTLLAENIPSVDLADLQQSGLTLALRLAAGDAALASGQNRQAISNFALNVALEKRLDAQFRVQLVPTAMLPDPSADVNSVPQAPTFASLLGQSRLGLAKAYLNLHRPDDAKAQYIAVRAYLANWPATAPDRETMTVVDSWARLGLAEAAYAARDYPGAFNILEGDGWPGGLPDALENRRKELTDVVNQEQTGQAQQDVQQQMNLSPDQARIQAMQQEIADLQKQRDSMAADLTDPNLSDRERQIRQESIDQLDSLIARRQAALEKLQQ